MWLGLRRKRKGGWRGKNEHVYCFLMREYRIDRETEMTHEERYEEFRNYFAITLPHTSTPFPTCLYPPSLFMHLAMYGRVM